MFQDQENQKSSWLASFFREILTFLWEGEFLELFAEFGGFQRANLPFDFVFVGERDGLMIDDASENWRERLVYRSRQPSATAKRFSDGLFCLLSVY